MTSLVPVTRSVTAAVETFVRGQFSDAEQYSNSTVLDESGVWLLHELAATIYAEGFNAGVNVQMQREQGTRERAREAARRAAEQADPDPTPDPVTG